jgi:hypothetical protein
MEIIRTVPRDDFGLLDRRLIKGGLLAETGVCGVTDGPGEHCLSIEYDSAILDETKLMLVMCRHGLCPDPGLPRNDRLPLDDG